MQSGTTGIYTLRIYNPTKQAIDQDPRGIFIRRWLPELAGVPNVYLHMPWTMPLAAQQAAGCRIGRDYPAPIVDHAAAVREAKARLAAARGSSQARAEARDVARRHGSRRDRRGAMQQDPVRRTLAGPGKSRAARPRSAGDRPVRDPQQWLPFADETDPDSPAS
jgi:deoxyribodipyrimidine photo-lyase